MLAAAWYCNYIYRYMQIGLFPAHSCILLRGRAPACTSVSSLNQSNQRMRLTIAVRLIG